jgi:hypothetical protein
MSMVRKCAISVQISAMLDRLIPGLMFLAAESPGLRLRLLFMLGFKRIRVLAALAYRSTASSYNLRLVAAVGCFGRHGDAGHLLLPAR